MIDFAKLTKEERRALMLSPRSKEAMEEAREADYEASWLIDVVITECELEDDDSN